MKHTLMVRLLIVLCLLISGGCINNELARRSIGEHYRSDNFYISPDPADTALRRVVIIPFFNESQYPDAADKVTKAFGMEIEKLHRFEIVAPGRYEKELRACNIFQDGKFDRTKVYVAAKALGVQGVLYGCVKQYRPYKPLVVGVKAGIIRAETGEMVWAVDDVYDASQQDVANRAYMYSYKKIEPIDNGRGDLILTSMRMFTAFVCRELVSSLQRAQAAMGNR